MAATPAPASPEVRGAPSIATTLEAGHRIDRYTIEEPIGEGGMGRVFRAHDERLDRRVALKLVVAGRSATGPDDEARHRLLREARAASRLDHPNVVAVFDVGESELGPYIVMELVPGRSLRAAIDADDLAIPERVRILREVAIALAAAHDAGIVHRDVKPENVIVRPDGRVKVLDFGIARAAARTVDGHGPTGPGLPTLTTQGAAVGTPRYMAPEQIRGGPIDGRTDQFGWGILAHELLEGRPPFGGVDALAVMAAVLTEEPEPVRGAPPAVTAAVQRALRKAPAERHASLHEVVAALDDGVEARGATAATPAERAPTPPVEPRRERDRGGAAASGGPGVAAPTLSRRWSAKELEEIFDRALAVQRTGYGYGEIVAAAREIGVDHEALERAMRELERRGAVEPRPQRQGSELRGLLRHAGIWLAVSFGLFLMNVFDPTSVWWFQWTMIPWGIAVAIHAVVALTRGPRKHRPGRRSKDRTLEADAAQVAAYLADKHARLRIDPSVGAAHEAAPDDGAALDAELEAMAAEEAARRARR